VVTWVNSDRMTVIELMGKVRLMAEAASIFEEEVALSEKDEEGNESNYDAEHNLKNIFDTFVQCTWENHKTDVTSSISVQSNEKVTPTLPIGLADTYKSIAVSSPKSPKRSKDLAAKSIATSSPTTSAGKNNDNNSNVVISTPNLRKRKHSSMHIDSPERTDIR
jgi:hypothetical protein